MNMNTLMKKMKKQIQQIDKSEVIETSLLRGKLALLQPKVGFHASVDTVFLSFSMQLDKKSNVLDVGCGVGSAGLCLTLKNKNIQLFGLDIQQDLVDLAHQNARLNGLEDRCQFFCGSLLSEGVIPDNHFNAVLMNPPYQEAGRHTSSPEKIKAMSHGEEASGARLEDWVKYAHRKLKNGGYLSLIHRADRLDDVVVALEKRRWFGSLVVYPLFSYAGENAKRVIVRARKERYAPLVLKSGMVIHEKGGKYTEAARAVLEDGAALEVD